jgi:5'-3' exonuclease
VIETALIDGDIVAYRCSAANEQHDLPLVLWQTAEMMRRILHETNAMQHRCFLTGGNNFRYTVYPEYKAHRKDMPKPKWLQHVREYLVTDWQATVTDGIEADDAIGIAHCSEHNGDSIVCSIDKDLLMLPGHNYNFVKQEQRHISPLEGLRNFYGQLIMGDRSDNIPGYDGKMRVKVPKFLEGHFILLEEMTKEYDMYEYVYDMWEDKELFMKAAKCLWIMRKENNFWQIPEKPTTGDNGPPLDSILL